MRILKYLSAVIVSLTMFAATPEKLTVYVGTYTGGTSKGIYAYEFNTSDGSLKQVGLAAETPSPSFLAIHPNNQFLYAVNELDNFNGEKAGAITGYKIDPANPAKLTKINTVSSKGAHPCHIIVDKSGKHVLVANYTGGNVVAYPIDAEGKLAEKPSAFIQHTGSSVDKSRQKEAHAHSINLDSAQRFAFVADLGLDKIMIYKFDPAAGTLSTHAPFGTIKPGGGPRHLAFSPDGKRAFANHEMTGEITGFNYDPAAGTLTPFQTLSTLPGGNPVPGNSTAEILVHPTGKFVYCSNRGHNSIAVFTVAADGKLTYVENESTRGKTPRNFNIDPTGKFLIAANQDSDSLAVYKIDQSKGSLEPVGDVVSAPKPVCIKFFSGK
ncbi:MAG TPA: lactonase family protein [Verrucomicrobiae bacterium]